MLASVRSQVSTVLAGERSILLMAAGLMFSFSLFACLAGAFTVAILPSVWALRLAWRAMSLVPEAMQELEERERDEWRSIAKGPVLRCPHCPWVSHNGNVTHCAECGTPLQRVLLRNLS